MIRLIMLFVMAATSTYASTLDDVKQRGHINCGVSTGLPGFSIASTTGEWSGMDVDICKAVSAAIFNNPSKVKFIPLSTKDRFISLQSGDIDILTNTTTWTLSREAQLGFEFTAVNYYDGQGFLVRKSLNIKSAKELNGATVCVRQGTTTEMNLSDYFRSNNMKLKALAFASNDQTIDAYEAGRCDAFTTDVSGLYAERLRLSKPEEHLVLSEVISKEPLSPAVRKGDDKWLDIVKWSHYAMITAEELGVNSNNIDSLKDSSNPDIRRLIGIEGKYGESLGLSNDWAYRIIKYVGNYEEIFEKNIGNSSALKISRGINSLWNKGGLQYAPPIR